ncbi:MAG: methyltransferase domain-containing protein [Vicinamibacteria bacterium]
MTPAGAFTEVPLRCPACGVPFLALRCEGCGTHFADVDGIVCASDRDELQRSQGPMLAAEWLPGDDASLAAACDAASALDPVGLLWRERMLEAVFTLAHYPEHATAPIAESLRGNAVTLAGLGAWIDRHATPAMTPALDVGCGPGRLLFDLAPRFAGGVIGLDLRVGMLRIARRLLDAGRISLPWRLHGRAFVPITVRAPRPVAPVVRLVQGSVYRAPVAPAGHALVSALSLLDILPDPLAGLAALDALVAPHGLLLVASPYQWDPDVTPPERWWSSPEATLRDALTARGYRLIEEAAALPWAIPSHDRLVHHYALHAVLARKMR